MMEVRTGHVRVVISDPSVAEEVLAQARRERERFMRRMWRARNRDKVIGYHKARRAKKDEKAKERERKRRWNEANRERLRAYFRNYDATAPGRREYKAAWERARRARLKDEGKPCRS